MVAGSRVPAAYRKGNRRSHLTGDTVYRTGAILVPSGKKLTVGQQRRRRQQRGGTGRSSLLLEAKGNARSRCGPWCRIPPRRA